MAQDGVWRSAWPDIAEYAARCGEIFVIPWGKVDIWEGPLLSQPRETRLTQASVFIQTPSHFGSTFRARAADNDRPQLEDPPGT